MLQRVGGLKDGRPDLAQVIDLCVGGDPHDLTTDRPARSGEETTDRVAIGPEHAREGLVEYDLVGCPLAERAARSKRDAEHVEVVRRHGVKAHLAIGLVRLSGTPDLAAERVVTERHGHRRGDVPSVDCGHHVVEDHPIGVRTSRCAFDVKGHQRLEPESHVSGGRMGEASREERRGHEEYNADRDLRREEGRSQADTRPIRSATPQRDDECLAAPAQSWSPDRRRVPAGLRRAARGRQS